MLLQDAIRFLQMASMGMLGVSRRLTAAISYRCLSVMAPMTSCPGRSAALSKPAARLISQLKAKQSAQVTRGVSWLQGRTVRCELCHNAQPSHSSFL